MAAVAVTLGPPQAVGTTWWRGRARDFHRSIRRRYEARCAFVRAWRRNSGAQWNFERRVWSIWARHLAPDDRERVVVRTHQLNWYRGMVDGLMVMPLSEFGTTHTAMVRWAPGTYFNPHRHLVERSSLWSEACFRTSMETTLKAAGFAVPTSASISRSVSRGAQSLLKRDTY